MASAFTKKQACVLLIKAAKVKHLAVENPMGRYSCVLYAEPKQYFIFQLHYAGGEPKDWVGSTLAGYYAVRKGDHAVLQWDFANDIPGKTIGQAPNWR
ncbi:MAG: hypothetical protein LBQ20_09640 [Rhodanobacter sp.]|nr:hypothetical protein [Rhodanobacter sp.]